MVSTVILAPPNLNISSAACTRTSLRGRSSSESSIIILRFLAGSEAPASAYSSSCRRIAIAASSSSPSESSSLRSVCPRDDLLRFAMEVPRIDIAGVVPGVSTSIDDALDVFVVDDLCESIGLFGSLSLLNRDRSIAETFGRTTPLAIRDDGRTTISS